MTGFADRMVGAARLDVAVYEEVEADTAATLQAMAVVILASIAAGIGSVGVGQGGVGNIVVSGVGSLVGWVVWAFMTYLIGTRLLPEPQTQADTGQLMRTLGFAQAPGIGRVFVGVPMIGGWVLLLVSLWMLVAMIIAVRQALDYRSTWRALAVCVIGWVIAIVIPAIALVMTGAPAGE